MVRKLTYLRETPSQTAGPYVHIGLAPAYAGFEIFENNFTNTVAGPDVPGERIVIEGCVYDGTGTPLRDVLLESWQADANGHYRHPDDPNHGPADDGFRGWGRMCSHFETGVFSLETIKPGPVPGRNGRLQAPHISLWIVARGINIGLQTRLYFGEETDANAADPVLNLIEQESRRQTLIAQPADGTGTATHRFDIHLQGEKETVFFDV
ncbi:MAG: protocatechuate 3,4-dioxygenase subunit alpha [Roseibium sp.]|nr:protocatechuate 3,4-dioxygenase subunit alpha [Roseibium sp.]